MSTSVQPQNQQGAGSTPTTSPSSAPNTGTPTSDPNQLPSTAPTQAVPVAEPRIAENDTNYPVWARGKTLREVVGLGDSMYNTVQQYIQSPAPVHTQPQSAPQPTQNAPGTNFGASSGGLGVQYDPDAPLTLAALQQLAPQFLQGQAQQIQRNTEQSAGLALNVVKTEHGKVFDKWGPEIYGYLSRVPKTDWTVDNLKQVVNIVRGNHVDELAREEAQRLVAGSDAGVLRSTTGAALSPGAPQSANVLSPENEKIPAPYRAKMAQMGINAQVMDEWCRVNNMTHEQFIKQFEHTAITETGNRAVMERGSNDPNTLLR